MNCFGSQVLCGNTFIYNLNLEVGGWRDVIVRCIVMSTHGRVGGGGCHCEVYRYVISRGVGGWRDVIVRFIVMLTPSSPIIMRLYR